MSHFPPLAMPLLRGQSQWCHPKWDCAALSCPWGSLWPAHVINDHHQAISLTYGLPWGSTTCRNTSGDASNGVCTCLCLWIYTKPSVLDAIGNTPSGWQDVFFFFVARVCVRTFFQHLRVFVWTKRTSAHVSSDLNVLQTGVPVYTQLIKRPSDSWIWLMPMCVNNVMCLFKTWSLTCSNSNSKPVCLSHWIAILNQQDLCQRSDNHNSKTSLSKSVVSQSNANTRLESEPDAALPLLPPYFSLLSCCFLSSTSLLQFLKAETALWESDHYWVHMHTHTCGHTRTQ